MFRLKDRLLLCRQAWASTTEEKREKKRLVRKVMLRFRNMHMSQCFTHWSGKIREMRKHQQDQAYQQQQASLQACLARLDPDGDGVVDQDEFTRWAKEQALRVELWEQKLDSAFVELRERVDETVNQVRRKILLMYILRLGNV